MINLIQAEWLKEKRSANKKLLFVIPIIFIFYSLLLSYLMGGSENAKLYLVTTAYNWYPLMILPIFISLLSCNSLAKERKHKNDLFYQSLNISSGKVYLAKVIVVTVEFILIMAVSFALLWFIDKGFFRNPMDYREVFLATIYLVVGSLPLLAISFFIYRLSNHFVVILGNFLLSIIAAVVAIQPYWIIFPWSYSLRMMAPALGIHPNGTFVEAGSYLLNGKAIPIGLGVAVGVFLVMSALTYYLIERREKNV
ncbi:lantibiotic immunity ABC transporter MutE/EpiE family permease subunit [Irregularibacter muris]|uniref:Lantibiotic immunity ABC transporter MutE/EpiE family permease subunit n=1 Tax=Irregularibacter muris TaxID=1796619 RepID=A0AAE3HGD4_9FIRM|nr:lantibiotic immunity ABC transporter MutE/EpiE family permease subunit [Irregularibacter muris]MCR1898914.1 lantibiotic immunity ABC transporter MutE/EpiE family permease subunit [Irregularibacter muris]